MPVTLHVAFERLNAVLEEARRLPRAEAYHLLRDAVLTIEPDSELGRWFLRQVAELLALNEDGA